MLRPSSVAMLHRERRTPPAFSHDPPYPISGVAASYRQPLPLRETRGLRDRRTLSAAQWKPSAVVLRLRRRCLGAEAPLWALSSFCGWSPSSAPREPPAHLTFPR